MKLLYVKQNLIASKIKYGAIVISLLVVFGCKNHTGNNGGGNTDPFFQSDPELKKITNQIISTPGDAALYYSRGGMLHRMQMDSLAMQDYKMAASLDSTKAEYFSAIGDLLFEHKDISGSVQWIQKAIALNPQDRKARLKIAKLFLYIHQYPNAIKEIDIALRKDVYDPEGYYLKGMVYKYMKDTARAISNFQTAIQVSPEYRDAIIQLGLIYSDRKDSIALRYFDNAYKIDSNDVFPIFAKGVFYQNNHNYEQAKEEYRKCIIRNNHYVDAYFNMGYILMQQDSVQKSYRQYDIATKIDYTNPTAYYNRGVCDEIMDSIKQAVEDYRKALALDTGYNSPKVALKRLKVPF